MVSPDWVDEMRNIMGGSDANTDDDHVYMMFSATFPKEARAIAKEYMSKDHIRIRVGRAGSSHMNIIQKVKAPSQFWLSEAYIFRSFSSTSLKSAIVSSISCSQCHLLVPLFSSTTRRRLTFLMTSFTTVGFQAHLYIQIALSESARTQCKPFM